MPGVGQNNVKVYSESSLLRTQPMYTFMDTNLEAAGSFFPVRARPLQSLQFPSHKTNPYTIQ